MSPLKPYRPYNATQGYNIGVSDAGPVFKSPPKDRSSLEWELRYLKSLDDETKEPVPRPEWYPEWFGIKKHENTQNRSLTPSTPSVSAYLVDPDIDHDHASVKSKEVVVLNNIDNLNNKEEEELLPLSKESNEVYEERLEANVEEIEVEKRDVEGDSQEHTNLESDGVRERTDVANKAHGKPPIWRVYERKNKKKKKKENYVASKAHGKHPIWKVYVRKNKKENGDVVEGVMGA